MKLNKNTIKKVCETNNKKIFYKMGNDEITYMDLFDRADELSKKITFKPVILKGDNDIDMLISIFACLLSKSAYIPINKNIPAKRLKNIENMSEAQMLINGKSITKLEIPKIHNYDLDIAYIIFTSGTTGEPKGVPISYENLENFIKWILKIIPSYKSLRVYNHASFSFDLSLVSLWYSFFNGGTLINKNFESYEDIGKIVKMFKDEKVDVIVATPTFIKLCLLDYDFSEEHISTLKCIYFCGEVLDVQIVRKLNSRFKNIIIINAYGPTEATSAVSAIRVESSMLNGKSIPIGDMKKNAVKIKVSKGEIVLKGKSVFNGYIGQTIKEYKTGDKGYIKDNLLYYDGRLDNQIKYNGYRIELEDIEANIKSVNDIEECIVIPKYKDDGVSIKFLKAFVTSNKKIDLDLIKNTLRDFIPNYMIPKEIVQIDKIPITPNGKVDRKAVIKW